jgi:hypothetical protein
MPKTDTDTDAQSDHVLNYYRALSGWLRPAVQMVAPEADTVLSSGRHRFEAMLDELPYVDRPEHRMADSMFACAAILALFEILRQQGVDEHTWGRAIHGLPAAAPQEDDAARERADAKASQSGASPNEFVFELLEGDEHSDRGMNITSCAICHLFGKHDAMELVPYMCSLDDVMSDAAGQGLRRTGTIALGASQCDFRFRQGGKPLRVAEQYPDQIRLENVSPKR